MAKICEVCFGTGKTPAGFCPCDEGKMLKVNEKINEKVKRQEEIEKEQKKEKKVAAIKKVTQKKDAAPIPYLTRDQIDIPGTDWVEISAMRTNRGVVKNVKGYIVETDSHRQTLLIQTVGLNERYGTGNVRGWVNVSDIKFLAAELTTGDVEAMIDLALLLNDKPWFEELVKMEVAR